MGFWTTRALIVSIAVASTLAAAACSDSSDTKTAAPASATNNIGAAATKPTAALIQPVPDSHKNKYLAGPFTITMVQGIAKEPNGSTTGSEILVENTSNDFTGYAQPEVQYFQGPDVLGTNVNTTDSLAPGQRQTIWVDAVVNKDVSGQWVDAQLVTLWFSTGKGEPGTRLQLAH